MAESSQPSQPTPATVHAPVTLPRVTITYCTQCRWLLRAAWLQQELLSTFSTTIGEIALIPSTGGIFRIHLTYVPTPEQQEHTNEGASEALIWDRKAEGGFPEAKVLKQRVRDHIEPGRGLGHSDVGGKKGKGVTATGETEEATAKGSDGGAPDLAGSTRAEGPKNPLVARMRPEVGERKVDGESEGKGGDDCEDCK